MKSCPVDRALTGSRPGIYGCLAPFPALLQRSTGNVNLVKKLVSPFLRGMVKSPAVQYSRGPRRVSDLKYAHT